MATPFELLTNGSVFTAVYELHYGIMSHWWIILLFIFTVFAAQIGTKHEAITFLVSLMGTAFLILGGFIPSAIHWIFYLICVLTLAMVLYKTTGPDN